jgi:hypothetical protein
MTSYTGLVYPQRLTGGVIDPVSCHVGNDWSRNAGWPHCHVDLAGPLAVGESTHDGDAVFRPTGTRDYPFPNPLYTLSLMVVLVARFDHRSIAGEHGRGGSTPAK